jgi:prolactin regulatory element-binding protein
MIIFVCSESGQFLVSLGGPVCRVWDVNASAAVASLSKEKDEMFASCRFSVDSAGNEVLYIAANTERGGSIITCDTKLWKRKWSKPIKKNSISAFNVSADGKLLAM